MRTLLASGHDPAAAQVSGSRIAFWVLAAVGAVAVVAAFTLVRGRALEQVETELVPG
jgi:hypothetical protein